MEDWLLLPGEQPAEKTELPEKPDEILGVPTNLPEGMPVVLDPPEISEQALELAQKKSEARVAYGKAWSKLTARQKVFLRAMQQTGFRVSAATKIVNELPDRFGKFNGKTAHRWARENEHYRLVLEAMKAEVAKQVTSRDDLLLRAHRIAEQAEDGEPVFGYNKDRGGHEVIGYEKKLDTALRANEQLMKATKVLGNDNQGNANNSGQGPALVIQVVQKGGGVIDVTPSNVTIDLPVPDGP